MNRKFRFYPLFLLSLLKAISYATYGTGLPNYLIFTKGLSADLVGIIIAAYPIAYILGPILLQPVTTKIGMKAAINMSIYFSFGFLIIQVIFIEPIVLILCRIGDGLLLGLFWPNLQMEISNWQEFSIKAQNDKYYSNFNLSFNLGFLVGNLVGFLIVFIFQNDLIAIYLSIILAGIMIPIGNLYDDGKHLRYRDNQPIYIQNLDEGRASSIDKDIQFSSEKIDSNPPLHLHIPIWFCYGGALLYSIGLALYQFTLPFLIQNIGFESYWVYLFAFVQQFTQYLGIGLINHISVNNQTKIYFISINGIIINTIFLIYFPNFFMLGISMAIIGLFGGFIYGFALKIMFDYGTQTKSSKYAILSEVYLGIGFGVTPFLAGLIINIQMNWVFIGLIGINLLFMLISTGQMKKKKM